MLSTFTSSVESSPRASTSRRTGALASYINQQGLTLYLKASPDVLYKHLKMGKTVRPLLLNKTPDEVERFISDQLAAREPYYLRAHHTLDVSLMDNYEKIKISVAQARAMLNV